jgi:UDP:flavonoid glycosyltransferase YjiC (YdhE family)
VRVLAATTAGAGHFAGVLPFARACAEAGHDVRVAAPRSFAGTVQQASFIHEVLADVDPAALGQAFGRIPSLLMREAEELVIQEVFGRLNAQAALPGMREILDRWLPDVVLREPAEVASYVAAAERDIPHVQTNIGLSSLDDLMLPLLDEPLAELGADTTGLRTAPRWTVTPPTFDEPSRMTLGSVTHARVAAAPRTADPLPDWWRDNDDPLAYMTFGSVAASVGFFPAFYITALEQLRELPVRILLTLGEAGDTAALGTLPPNVHVERWWPQQDVLAQAAVIIGHGGFGTTHSALVSAVPQVVIPLFSFDQFANAERVAAVGVGVALIDEGAAERRAGEVIPAGPQAVERLGEAVTGVLQDEVVRAASQRLAAEIRSLPPAAECVATLEAMR